MWICIMRLSGLARFHCRGNTCILATVASNGCTPHSAAGNKWRCANEPFAQHTASCSV